MIENHILDVRFCGQKYYRTRAVTRYDYGQILRFIGFDLPDAFEVHFALAGSNTAITQIGSDNIVTIPDELIRTNASIRAWLFLHDAETDGETVYTIGIPVMDRAMPTDREPTPTEQSVIDQTIAALNAAVEKANEYLVEVREIYEKFDLGLIAKDGQLYVIYEEE